jgi:hypothetical protein
MPNGEPQASMAADLRGCNYRHAQGGQLGLRTAAFTSVGSPDRG